MLIKYCLLIVADRKTQRLEVMVGEGIIHRTVRLVLVGVPVTREWHPPTSMVSFWIFIQLVGGVKR